MVEAKVLIWVDGVKKYESEVVPYETAQEALEQFFRAFSLFPVEQSRRTAYNFQVQTKAGTMISGDVKVL